MQLDVLHIFGHFFLAVNAHIRHTKTSYDELLIKGYDRKDAGSLVDDEIQQILKLWESGK